jgi:hypothetical protein
MNCEHYDDVLDDYVDGARAATGRSSDARLAAFEAHLPGCQRCRALVADFSSIRREAADLDEVPLPARLWARVASAIEADARTPWWQRTFGNAVSGWMPAAVAAALALVVGGGLWFSRSAAVEAPQTTEAPAAADAAVAPAEQHYEEAIDGLQHLADEQKRSLDPQTLAILQQNLAVVDRAINESRAALSSEPTSAAAQDSLLDALDTKVSLLQDTVALGSEGTDVFDDAAGAAKELNQ